MLTLFYCIALALGLVYSLFLIFHTKWTLEVPKNTWDTERRWARETGIFYAVAILGLVINGFILLPMIDNFSVRLAVSAGGMLTAGLSLIIDIRRLDFWGIALDVGILVSLGIVLYL